MEKYNKRNIYLLFGWNCSSTFHLVNLKEAKNKMNINNTYSGWAYLLFLFYAVSTVIKCL